MIPFSVLDLAFVTQGSTPADALRNTLDLARHAELWGYRRFWVAEHHNMIGIASAATSVVIGHVAGGTKTIRVGAGGIMLPNHAPLVIAEQFGTLETLYPGRIDLGLGRAPGTDGRTLRSLRRDPMSSDRFPQDVLELQSFFAPSQPGQAVQAVPGADLNIPIWILGSSVFGAQLAAAMGLPYAYAAHFSPGNLNQALDLYRAGFKPSAQLERPYAMIGISAIAAETDDAARRLFTSSQQAFTNMVRGMRGKLQPPIEDIETYWLPGEKAQVSSMLARAVVGSVGTVRTALKNLVDETGADELMLVSAVYDHAARLRSYETFRGNPERLMTKGILLDIEGTTTPISFVYDVLFPFAREHVHEHLGNEDQRALNAEYDTDVAKGLRPPPWSSGAINYIHWLMDQDRKSTALKSLQGKIWQEGYRRGNLQGSVFPDVPPALARWYDAGIDIRIYSSGSILAQQLLFSTTPQGDLTRFLKGYFDTTTGPKTEASSYTAIATAFGLVPKEILFISDVTRELDAASAAGLQVLLADRPGNHPQPPHQYDSIPEFGAVLLEPGN